MTENDATGFPITGNYLYKRLYDTIRRIEDHFFRKNKFEEMVQNTAKIKMFTLTVTENLDFYV